MIIDMEFSSMSDIFSDMTLETDGDFEMDLRGATTSTDHRFLSHRNDADQHPISAISNLESRLGNFLEGSDVIGDDEIENL